MNREQFLKHQNEQLLKIAIQAKRLLLSNEIPDASPETINLCELIERYEEEYLELTPQLKPYGKKAWYSRLDKNGQVVDLQEILALSSEDVNKI
jgi:hypothetical protein